MSLQKIDGGQCYRKQIELDEWEWKYRRGVAIKVPVLDKMIRICLIEKVRFEQSLIEVEGVSYVGIWGRVSRQRYYESRRLPCGSDNQQGQ